MEPNYTYEMDGSGGYYILDNGVRVYHQPSHIQIPKYKSDSIGQTAQNHINDLLREYEASITPSADERIDQLQQHISDLQDALIELAGMITAGGA